MRPGAQLAGPLIPLTHDDAGDKGAKSQEAPIKGAGGLLQTPSHRATASVHLSVGLPEQGRGVGTQMPGAGDPLLCAPPARITPFVREQVNGARGWGSPARPPLGSGQPASGLQVGTSWQKPQVPATRLQGLPHSAQEARVRMRAEMPGLPKIASPDLERISSQEAHSTRL